MRSIVRYFLMFLEGSMSCCSLSNWATDAALSFFQVWVILVTATLPRPDRIANAELKFFNVISNYAKLRFRDHDRSGG